MGWGTDRKVVTVETQSTLARQVSLDANGELLINGQRASTDQLEAMLAQKPPATPSGSTGSMPGGFSAPTTASAGATGVPTGGRGRSTSIEPFARAGILSLLVVVFAAALKVAFVAHTSAKLARAYAGLTRFGTIDNPTPQPPKATTHPLIAAIIPFLIVIVVGGAIAAGLRWWHRKSGALSAVGVAAIVALGGVFVFASDLWKWTSYFELNGVKSIVSEALKRDTTWASLLGFGGSVAAVALLGMGIKTALDRRL
jgi:hypothetical protein